MVNGTCILHSSISRPLICFAARWGEEKILLQFDWENLGNSCGGEIGILPYTVPPTPNFANAPAIIEAKLCFTPLAFEFFASNGIFFFF